MTNPNVRARVKTVVELPPAKPSWVVFWLYVLLGLACFAPIAVIFVLARRWL